MRSFLKAIDLGAPWVECDARAVEGEAVVFHDRTLERLAGVSGVVSKQSLHYLRSLPLRDNERIPLLSEVFSELAGKCSLQIELKGAASGRVVARQVLAALKQGWSAKSLLVSSFDYEELREFKEIVPHIPIGILVYGFPLNCIGIARDLKAFSVHLHIDSISKDRMLKLHDAGLKVFVYTANQPDDIAELVSLGVDGIFSDFPERVLNAVSA